MKIGDRVFIINVASLHSIPIKTSAVIYAGTVESINNDTAIIALEDKQGRILLQPTPVEEVITTPQAALEKLQSRIMNMTPLDEPKPTED